MHEVTRYPQMPAMSDADLDEFLAGPHLARLSTIDPDGTPHTMPVWYEWRNGEVLISTQSLQRKVANIRRDPRVTILVDSDEFPYRGVMIRGEATLDFDDAVGKRVSIFERYMGDRDRAEAYAQALAAKWQPVLVRVTPSKVISFDYGDASLVPVDD